ESGIGNRESGIGNRESGIGNREKRNAFVRHPGERRDPCASHRAGDASRRRRPRYTCRMSTPADTARPPLSPRHWPTWIGIGAMAAAARLPWPLQRALGRMLGALLRVALRSRRDVAARNLALCFPEFDDAARVALLREHFAALGTGVFEFARAWWGSVAPMRKGLVVEGLEHSDAARADGRGVLVVSGHFSALEICGRLMCEQGVPLAGMYRPHAEPAMEWAVRRGRARYAAAMFPKQDVRGAVRHL